MNHWNWFQYQHAGMGISRQDLLEQFRQLQHDAASEAFGREMFERNHPGQDYVPRPKPVLTGFDKYREENWTRFRSLKSMRAAYDDDVLRRQRASNGAQTESTVIAEPPTRVGSGGGNSGSR